MKTRKFILAVLAAAGMLSAQSCLKEQVDSFEEPSSERMENYLLNINDILTENGNGWILEYYPGTGQKYGGYTYVLLFDGTQVTVYGENAAGQKETSYYKFTRDNGPVLSFDTYNSILHSYATPSSKKYEAMGGDFEFSIMDVSGEDITLLGKRSSNICHLKPLPEEYTPEQYMEKIISVSESCRASSVEGTIGSEQVSGVVDLNNRRIIFSLNAEGSEDSEASDGEDDEIQKIEMPFHFTPEGIRAYSEMKIGGCTFQDIAYLEKNNIFTNGVFSLQGKVSDDYSPYEAFLGDFRLNMYNGKLQYDVTLSKSEDGKGYVLSGLNEHFTLDLGYDRSSGRATLQVQNVGITSGSNYAMWAAWDLGGGGSLTWAEGAGMDICLDLDDPSGSTFKFVDNGKTEGMTIDSFILWEFDGSGNRIGNYRDWGNYGQYPYIQTLVRK